MATPNLARPASQNHKPITYTPHQVALMAFFANSEGDALVKAAVPHFTQEHLGYYLGMLVESETPTIPLCIARVLNLKPNRKGGFTWKVQ